MLAAIDRREFLFRVGSFAALSSFGCLQARADLDFGTVLGAVGVGLFPGAAAAIGGFDLIRLIGDADKLVKQTADLEIHIDSVLTQVSATLLTVQSFVQDCDRALLDIESLIKHLPDTFLVALNESAARKAFGDLQGHRANMASYLRSRGSIVANRARIQDLCEKIVDDTSAVYSMEVNMLQFVMQVVPSLTTWMQGYTSYNLLLPGEERGESPWEHELVKTIAVPRINALLDSIKQQRKDEGAIDSRLPLNANYLYIFDGTTFKKTDRGFAYRYLPGEIDDGYYYALWPEVLASDAERWKPRLVHPGDLCYLQGFQGMGQREWEVMPPTDEDIGDIRPPEIHAAQRAAFAYTQALASALKSIVAFNELTEGWQVFDGVVQEKLVTGDRELWTKMPRLRDA